MSYYLPIALDKERQSYDRRALRFWQGKARFLNTLKIYNISVDEIRTISFDPEWEIKYNELYYINKFNYIHAKAIDNSMIPIFVTLTLPSAFHKFKKRGKTFIPNPNYNELLTVTEGYQQLNKIFRSLYNNFKVYEGGSMVHISTKFIKVIEPHKDFTPHLHSIIYIPLEYLKEFRQHFNNVVGLYGLKQIDYEELNKTLDKKYGSINYLLKYVGKTLGGNVTLHGWRLTYKIRAVTTSNIAYSKKVYDVFARRVGWNKTSKNIFFQMEEELTVVSHSCMVDKSYIGTFVSRNELLKQFVINDRFEKKEIVAKCEKYRYVDYKVVTVKPSNDYLITFENEKLYSAEMLYQYDDMFLRHDLSYDTLGEFDKESGLFVPLNVTNISYSYNTEFGDDETVEEVGHSKDKVYSEVVLYQTLSSSCAVGGTKIYDKSDYSVKAR